MERGKGSSSRDDIPELRVEDDDQEDTMSEGSIDRVLGPRDPRGSTPDNWDSMYGKYLQDSPIRGGTPRSHRGDIGDSPEQADKQKRAAEQFEAVERRAERFLRQNATPISTEDQKPSSEGIIAWVRVMNFDEVLLHPDQLFNTLGSTTPSIDSATMEELVLGQYELARKQRAEAWLRNARQWATMFFPLGWIDRHLQSFIQGKELRFKIPSQAPEISTTTMARDRRVTIEGQDLPCLRSDAANSSTEAQAREATDGGDIGHSESAGRPISASIRPERPHSDQPTTKTAQPAGSGDYPSGTAPGICRQSRTGNQTGKKRRAEQAEPRADVHSKKPLIDYQWQLCPAEGCDLRTKYLKDHVYKTHIPSLFHQLTLEDMRIPNTHRQRLYGLQQLAALTLGDGATPHDLVTAVNESIRRIISGRPKIWGQLQGDMAALCEFAGWEVPEQFEVHPELNSPASLLYWRVLVFLLDQLDAEDRREFCCAYDTSGAWRRQEPSGNQTQDTPSGPTHDTREETSETVLHQNTAQICVEYSGERSAVVTSKLDMSETEMVERTDLLDVELQQVLVTCSRDAASRQITLTTEPRRDPEPTVSPSPPQLPLHPQAFDSHFHLDRTARQLWERRDPSKVLVEDILQTHSRHQPNNPVELVGGVMVFCDFEDTFSIPLTDGKWKIAVGVHPRKAVGCQERVLTHIKALLDTNPLVKALGEFGLDRTEPAYTWSEQDRLFKRMLSLSRPDKVIVLHLRGATDRHSTDIFLAGLHYVRKACPFEQPIHLHCFTGTRAVVEDWLEEFPNTYFGFTARVTSFNQEQRDGVRAVPEGRVLLEAGSPCVPTLFKKKPFKKKIKGGGMWY